MQDPKARELQPGERSVDLMRLLRVVWKWKLMIIVIVLLAGTASYIYTQVTVTPVYRSGFTAYVNNRQNTENQNTTSSSDLTASKNLAYLYREIIVSRSVLVEAAQSVGLNYSYSKLYSMVRTAVAETTAIISVYVDAKSPSEAAQFAAAIAEAAPTHVARVVEGSSMRIVDSPVEPSAPRSNGSWNNAVNAGAIALLVSVVGVILLDLISDKVGSAKEIEDRYGIAVMGHIPDFSDATRSDQVYATKKHRRSAR